MAVSMCVTLQRSPREVSAFRLLLEHSSQLLITQLLEHSSQLLIGPSYKAFPDIWPILKWSQLRPSIIMMLRYLIRPSGLCGQFSSDKTVGLISGISG